ncbi:DUF4243 domain-containing protein [Streptomyces sp. TRM43335]|uniref:DUF4243 domain-containing protein n=1 Tax=Streptomyces taklimakanensis TaxID=2569853 RepID=A0A6G2BFU7_9ACTN|nr:questin oxidase family protein [Streptomyces taklimakanensis]MTE20996.1 DUF4243 domain-containing protein [Streptomyces taklimakanensis]
MAALSYTDAVNEALQRLGGVGFEHGPSLVNHAPMAAEALARTGYADVVPAWVDRNLRTREYHDRPERRWRLSPHDRADWEGALGDFGRVADWTDMFRRELDDAPWTEVLARWWPRLLPGLSGALTHGVIRTAHAVRALTLVRGDNRLQLDELSQGLGYWSARYSALAPRGDTAAGTDDGAEPDGDAVRALDRLVADASGVYAGTRLRNPIGPLHAITAPAAVRLVCEHLPRDQHRPSYLAALECSRWIRSWSGPADPSENARDEPPSGPELLATAVELGDEHAIKLAEVALRHDALAPDPRYAAAAHTANRAIRRFLR